MATISRNPERKEEMGNGKGLPPSQTHKFPMPSPLGYNNSINSSRIRCWSVLLRPVRRELSHHGGCSHLEARNPTDQLADQGVEPLYIYSAAALGCCGA
jgi:hypothetical protein